MRTVVGCWSLVVGCLDLILMDSASRAESQNPRPFRANPPPKRSLNGHPAYNGWRFTGSLTMPQGFIAHVCFLGLIVSAAVQAQQPKADSDVAISQTLQATEWAWLSAEKNHDVPAFEKIVA